MSQQLPQGNRKILLTGATGSIGPYLVPMLMKQGYNIVLLGRKRPFTESEQLKFIRVDFDSELPPKGVCRGCDAILHMANLSKVSPQRDHDVALTLAEDAIREKVPSFFFASSIRVYGKRSGLITEDCPAEPFERDAYACSKLRIEKSLATLLDGSDTRLKILRVGHILSPESLQTLPKRLSWKYLFVWGKSNPHFVWIDDAIEAICYLLARRDHLKGNIFNITRESEKPLQLNTFYANPLKSLKKYLTALGLPTSIAQTVFSSAPEAMGTRNGRITEQALRQEGFHFSSDQLEKILSGYIEKGSDS